MSGDRSRSVELEWYPRAQFLCLKALRIGHGNEVITRPMTFVAASNAFIAAGKDQYL
nr:hypothetical protein [Desulfobacterales bacterium]